MIIAFKAPDGVKPGDSSITFMTLDTNKGFEFMATTEDNSYGVVWDRYGNWQPTTNKIFYTFKNYIQVPAF